MSRAELLGFGDGDGRLIKSLLNRVHELESRRTNVPPGIVVRYTNVIDGNGPTAVRKPPSGYLWCNGDAISRSLYEGLFDTMGTNYGPGDGVTTFNLPNITPGVWIVKT